MKTTKKIMMVCCLMVLAATSYGQQWEIDFEGIGNYSPLRTGIINDNGEAVIMGECGTDNSHYYPMIMRVTPDGEYDYRVFDTIGINVSPTHIVQQDNGTYFASAVVQPDDLGVGENVVFLVLDSELNIVSMKSYEQPEMVLGLRGGRLMLDDDGTVVFSCAYWYQSTYGQRTSPCFYRFDMNADTLSCSYVTGTPDGYDCYQLLQKPDDDGFVVFCARLNNKCSLLIYDHDFNYVDGFILSPAYRQSFEHAYSDHWISNDKLLIMGDMWQYEEYDRWNIGMAEVGLDGTFDRWDRVYHKQDTAIQSSSDRCIAYVNDTTIYGGAWFYRTVGGESHGSVCLYDSDMELLGRKEFVEPEYGDKASCRFVLPTVDGGCLVGLLTYFVDNGHRSSKLIKMGREDFNPIPCSVKELPQEAIKALAYPNPAKDELNIDISGMPEHNEHRIQITDALGHICMDRVIRGEGNVLTLGVSRLKEGVYVYRVYDAERELLSGKWIKQ